ncbi:hypothetical protein AL035_02000 [Salipiger aestuarii]|uniref:Uncharacterized protein n=1 Tax=Salipiger aestuarii TaxID=568098 RepID=A0A327YTY0_9RHOB|nr:hypothetical protein [Salipiger aestuarii]KAB2543261.1 hypothetical protein AL035_02000 [Salipiger aestuarii]RAK24082.1 hypothetical protein ATI53_1001189 [Salipiger aestuarii]
MTHRTTHGPTGHEDRVLWYACEVMADAARYDIATVASACEVALDHPQATYADRQIASDLLADITRSAA